MKIIKAVMLAFLATAFACAAQAATWDMPTPYPENNFHEVNIKKFAEDVKAATGGALDIKVHTGGSLIQHPEIRNAVRSGQVPIGEFLLSRLSNENPVFGVDSVPFLATNYDQAMKLWKASKSEVEGLLAKQNLMVLFTVPWPPQGVYTKNPLKSVDDLKGVKFRAYNAATERLAELAGAVPTQVEVPDVPQAFATGRVDAMITSPSTGVNTKAWDFVNYFYHTQAWLPKNIVVVNRDAFEGLDAKTKKAVLAAAAKAQSRGWQMSKDETAKQMKVLAEHGMKVEKPGKKLEAGLQEIGKTMAEEWAEKAGPVGKKILEQYRM